MEVQGNKIIVGYSNGKDIVFDAKMANRHGLVAGATGTGKTYTIKALAEAFSEMGVSVFLADVKGDVVGLSDCNHVNIWDIYGENGIPLRATVDSMGSVLLARILRLNDLQADILSIAFSIASKMGFSLVTLQDLKTILNYMARESKSLEMEYGKISAQSISAIIRSVVALDIAGGEKFFGNPQFSIIDLFENRTGASTINILDSTSLVNDSYMYSAFMLWLMQELFRVLPEVGDVEKPKMVFFFDEAHLLFKGASKVFVEKVEQVVRLIRSKGVGVYFCTQNPKDIPDGVLAQLGNKIQHALHAYTPSEQKGVKMASASFRPNPNFNTYEAITTLGIGQALVSLLQEDGSPSVVEQVAILPPKSRTGCIDKDTRTALIESSVYYGKYNQTIDPNEVYNELIRTSDFVKGKSFGASQIQYLQETFLSNPSFMHNHSWKYGVCLYALDFMENNLHRLSNYDVAMRVCNSQELELCRFGSLQLNGESWQEVEDRAIQEAYTLARSILRAV